MGGVIGASGIMASESRRGMHSGLPLSPLANERDAGRG